MQVERNKTKEVDTSQLLAAMQSDKVAAARALTQNKQLKEQLEELQSGFIIMVRNWHIIIRSALDSDNYLVVSIQPDISHIWSDRLDNCKNKITVNIYLEVNIKRQK